MTHYTSQARAEEMSNVMSKVGILVTQVENGGINNISIDKLLKEDDLTILAKNGITNTNRTAKQIYNQIRTWFHNHIIAQYHIQVKGQNDWRTWGYASKMDEAKKVFESMVRRYPYLYNGDIRILNDFDGTKTYKNNNNWISFPKA